MTPDSPTPLSPPLNPFSDHLTITEHAAQKRLRKFLDRLAHVIVSTGGMATIVSVTGILVYLLIEVAPLGSSPEYSVSAHLSLDPVSLRSPHTTAIGTDRYREIAFTVSRGDIVFYEIASGKNIPVEMNGLPPSATVTAIGRASRHAHQYGLATDDGIIWPLTIRLTPRFDEGVRTIVPEVEVGEPFIGAPDGELITALAFHITEDGFAAVTQTSSGRIWFTTVEESSGLLFAGERTVSQVELIPEPRAPITALLLNDTGDRVIAGSAHGRLYQWEIQEPDRPVLSGTYSIGTTDAITALAFLIGERTIVVGTDVGQVLTWMLLQDPERPGGVRLDPVHTFTPHSSRVTHVAPSPRDRSFLTADETGTLLLHHSTSQRTLLQIPGAGQPTLSLAFAPKADGALMLDRAGNLRVIDLRNPHPEITWGTLFLPVRYEGYETPEHIWQSSSGSDKFEPKFGLVPLIFGTLKGTIYALLLAIPLAVTGAVYTAMFMHPSLRALVKPALEIMAALPSVVLGFLAGLWLAPLLERIFPALVGMMLLIPLAVIAAAFAWHLSPTSIKNRGQAGSELFLLMVVLTGTIVLCLSLNHRIESWLFGADYKHWLAATFDVHYDQRNALVISFAMGFAVIPIIFSISEDALSNVPKHLIAGSLALGATPWQTLTRLVLVSASPGIFSALMIGFGRAVGETMIVLMATGNTPIMDWSLFNGFRTLSANIAVEIPEAPHGGTLYRVLFFSALLLFAFTFIINTVAELIRQRLRAKYSQY